MRTAGTTLGATCVVPQTFVSCGFVGSSVHLQVAAQPFGRQGKWAEEEHLRGAKCAGKRERFNVVMGPFLAELLSKGAVKSEARLLPRTWQMERFPRIKFPSILVPAFKKGKPKPRTPSSGRRRAAKVQGQGPAARGGPEAEAAAGPQREAAAAAQGEASARASKTLGPKFRSPFFFEGGLAPVFFPHHGNLQFFADAAAEDRDAATSTATQLRPGLGPLVSAW